MSGYNRYNNNQGGNFYSRKRKNTEDSNFDGKKLSIWYFKLEKINLILFLNSLK
jgi:hypothetical protein